MCFKIMKYIIWVFGIIFVVVYGNFAGVIRAR